MRVDANVDGFDLYYGGRPGRCAAVPATAWALVATLTADDFRAGQLPDPVQALARPDGW